MTDHKAMVPEVDLQLVIAALENLSDGFMILDQNDDLLYCNQRQKDLFPDIEHMLVLGMPFEKIVRFSAGLELNADAKGRKEAWVTERMATHLSDDTQTFEQLATNGSWVEIRDTKLANGYRICFRTDITERKKAEQELRDQEALVNSILEAASVDISLKDLEGRLVKVNPQYAKHVGLTEKQLIGRKVSTFIEAKTATALEAIEKRVIETGEKVQMELDVDTAMGPQSRLSIKFPVRNADQAIVGVGGISADITDLKRVENALQDSILGADAASQAKSEFLSTMSHELRTPLHAILGYSHILLTDENAPLIEEQSELLGHIVKGGKHLLDLVNEVLDLTRIEAGKLKLETAAVDARVILDDALTFVEILAVEHNISIDDRSDKKLPHLEVDQKRAIQVVLNFLTNAIKYNQPGGKVWLETKIIDNGFLRISILDEGDGIPEDRQSQLFQPFSRLGAEETKTDGFGLGLALSKRIAEEMGSIITFNSIFGQGSQFSVDFPLSRQAPARTVPIQIHPETVFNEPLSANTKLLYVEDNVDNLSLMAKVINRIPNLSMASARTAETGLKMIATDKPDIIVLDINLPGMSGLEAIKLLKENAETTHIPVLALSADAMAENIEAGIQAGFIDYLTKPVDLVDLTSAIRRGLQETT